MSIDSGVYYMMGFPIHMHTACTDARGEIRNDASKARKWDRYFATFAHRFRCGWHDLFNLSLPRMPRLDLSRARARAPHLPHPLFDCLLICLNPKAKTEGLFAS
jgi:hypothetical protein